MAPSKTHTAYNVQDDTCDVQDTLYDIQDDLYDVQDPLYNAILCIPFGSYIIKKQFVKQLLK